MSLSFPSCHPSEILISLSLYADILYGVYTTCVEEYDDDNNDYSATTAGLKENLCVHVYPVEVNRIFMTSGK